MIAALHFNENSSHSQAVNKAGRPAYVQSFSKASKQFVVRKIKTKPTHGKCARSIISSEYSKDFIPV